jgi:hypothetical protein
VYDDTAPVGSVSVYIDGRSVPVDVEFATTIIWYTVTRPPQDCEYT